MEACRAVKQEVDRVLHKFRAMKDHSQSMVQELIDLVESIRKGYENIPEDQVLSSDQITVLNQAMSQVKAAITKVSTEHRNLHSTVSKMGKTIDQNFVANAMVISKNELFTDQESIQRLNQLICQHLFRQGKVEVGEELAKEVQIDIDEKQKESLIEVSYILEAIQQHDLQPAIAWARAHRDSLAEQNSSLEFMLHRMCFVNILKQGPSKEAEAINYARETFLKINHNQNREMEKLMGALLYMHQGLSDSPYSHFLDPGLWLETRDAFLRGACSVLQVSSECPLSVCINAGCTVLPALLKVVKVMEQRQTLTGLRANDDLPVDMSLVKDCKYHSMFSCPILRQFSDISNNPPMRLECGHVISRDALNMLADDDYLKCPYCFVEQDPENAQQVFF